MLNLGLESILPGALYAGAIAAFLLSVFWRPIAGIYYLTPLIPLQTIRYRLSEFPLGTSVVGVILLGVALGLLRRRQSVLPKTPWTALLCIYILYTFASLWVGSATLGAPAPVPGDPRFGVWQEYMTMPALLLLVAAVAPTRRQMRILIWIMCLAVLMLDRGFWNSIADRDFSSYSDDLHSDGGSMGYAGSNGLAAFEAQFAMFLVALASFEPKRILRLGYIGLAVYSAVCLMYSLSRGGYAALLMGWLFLGLIKQKKLLLLLIVFALTWTTVVPTAVSERVMMTYDEQSRTVDNSTDTRIKLWEDAIEIFRANPAFGTGFQTYAYIHRIPQYADTHNYFLKVMVETGAFGLILLTALLLQTLWTGLRLSRRARDPFLAALGLGLAGWVVCSITANCFGDRWTFLQINGYLWLLCGLVAQAAAIERQGEPTAAGGEGAEVPPAATAELQTACTAASEIGLSRGEGVGWATRMARMVWLSSS